MGRCVGERLARRKVRLERGRKSGRALFTVVYDAVRSQALAPEIIIPTSRVICPAAASSRLSSALGRKNRRNRHRTVHLVSSMTEQLLGLFGVGRWGRQSVMHSPRRAGVCRLAVTGQRPFPRAAGGRGEKSLVDFNSTSCGSSVCFAAHRPSGGSSFAQPGRILIPHWHACASIGSRPQLVLLLDCRRCSEQGVRGVCERRVWRRETGGASCW